MERTPDGTAAEPHIHSERPWRPSGKIIATAAALALLVKLLLAFNTYGTNDVYRWEAFTGFSRYVGVGLYRAYRDFNHPALMIHVVRFLDWLAKITGLPFAFWFRLPAILADLGTLWLVWKIMGPRVEERSIAWALLLLAVAPPLILISGFHGNTDPVMIFWLLLAVWLIERGKIWAAGAAFGLAMGVKVVPVMVAPVFFLYLANFRRQLQFFAAAGLVVLVGWSPFLFQDPAAIVNNVFGYRSYYGHWGLSWLAQWLAAAEPSFTGLNEAFRDFGAWIALGAVLIASLWMNHSLWTKQTERRPSLFSQVGVVFFLFLALSSGFGLQYLAWLVPWVVELGVLPTAMYYAASGVFLFLVYDYWSQGFPWYLADSNRVGDYQGRFDYSQLLCWLTVVIVLSIAWKRQRSPRVREPLRAWQMAAVLAAAVAVAYPLAGWTHARAPSPRVGAGEDAVNQIRAQQHWDMAVQLYRLERFQDAVSAAEQSLKFHAYAPRYLNLSVLYYRAGRYQESIDRARQALRLDPNLAEAYSNMGAGYLSLKMWDEAIRAANEALRLRPDFQPARNILAAASDRKQKSAR